MKAISLWQPWASLVVLGSKKIETRHWSTNYRGPLLIHAAKRCTAETRYLLCCWNFTGALKPLGISMGKNGNIEKLPFGAIIGSVDLVDCRPTESFTVGELDTKQGEIRDSGADWELWTERQFGNFDPGRFGWVFENPVMFPDPIPYKGQQGFFEVEAW